MEEREIIKRERKREEREKYRENGQKESLMRKDNDKVERKEKKGKR